MQLIHNVYTNSGRTLDSFEIVRAMTKPDFFAMLTGYFISDQKISAIKLIKDRYNLGLKDAKDVVDLLYEKINLNVEPASSINSSLQTSFRMFELVMYNPTKLD